MQTRFIDHFSVILLDMGNTFMFDVDRFSAVEDFGATYRQLGGRMLSAGEVHRIVSVVFDTMLSDYQNPDCYDRFPSVLSYLEAVRELKKLPASELRLLEHAFAIHEVGTVPDTYTEVLHRLRKTHRLGIVSNIWSKSDLYLKEFTRAGIRDLFDVIIFSSDYGHIKPSRYLFAQALVAFAVDRSQIVFVGDSLRCDVAGAKAVGLAAVWIDTGTGKREEGILGPDLVIRDLRELLEKTSH